MKGAAFAAWAAIVLGASAEDPFVRELDLRHLVLDLLEGESKRED